MILKAPFIKGKRFPWNKAVKRWPAYVCTRCNYSATMNNAWYFTRCDTCQKAAEHYERNHNK